MKQLVVFLALIWSTVFFASAEEALPWGDEISHNRCSQLQGGVWAEFDGGVECLRYFVGGKVDGAGMVIVVLRGDRDAWLRRDPEDIPQNTVGAQTALARTLSGDMGFPVVVVSRPGTFGASGDHRRRRQPEEFLAIYGALDNIRADHQIGKFVLLGHSGGATAGAAMLTLGRDDVACAVLTSGAFGLLERAEIIRREGSRGPREGYDLTGLPHPYDPLDHLEGVMPDPERRIIIIGNRDDQVTPFYLQEKFYKGLIALGHRAEMREAKASPPDFHNLIGRAGARAAAECAGEAFP